MRLLIIHGPPAAGKLTVATEVARRTGFKLFHNHVSIDCVKPVFDFGSASFDRLIETIRIEMIAEAARAGIDLIHTFVYAYGDDDAHFHKLIAAAEDNGGTVHIVLLRCADEVRKTRITDESRVRIGKLTDPESVDVSRQRYELESALPGRETLIIDTALTPPEAAALEVVDHFRLGRRLYSR